ncbi:hypothetical protein EJD97_014163 [Solanum chilense]|uniref:Uncharacterized protein n=1 Tax=Solanum chilense TaxID=4083 RepID=A0A6N2BC42_SOLCI|nr:hypothetical protein EJD97_014163 [Solanum chilense]
MVGRCWVCRVIIALGQHTWPNNVGCGNAIVVLEKHTRSDDVGRYMPSLSLGRTHNRTTSAWHAIIALGRHTRSDYVGRGMPSSNLGNTHDRTTSGMACHHRP